MRPQFDDKDAAILAERVAKWDNHKGPRVGDFVVMPGGELRRFTHDWGNDIQTTVGNGDNGSFYFSASGDADYSGGLDPAILKSKLTDTGETREGAAWIFHHDHHMAHNGVQVRIPCRVYRVEVASDE